MTDAASAPQPVTANFINPETMHHPAGYTHVVEVTGGRPVYIAGQVALDPTGALIGPRDIRAQARQRPPPRPWWWWRAGPAGCRWPGR
jgi:enamine deaminase RidA (YjgF/YER057c/UK114 family)